MGFAAILAWIIETAEANVERTRLGETAARIEKRIEGQVQVLYAVRALMSASERVDRHELLAFLDAIEAEERVPGMQGVGFALAIDAEADEPVRSLVRERYGIDRGPWPETDQAIRFPIVYLEPDDERNRAALAYDMYSEPVRREAMDAAWASNLPAATDRVTLVQEIDEQVQAGFLIYLPLYQLDNPSEIEGFVYAPFRARDLLEAALEGADEGRLVAVYSDQLGEDNQLFDSGRSRSRSSEHEIQVAGRKWVLLLEPSYAGSGIWRGASLVALLAGVLLALLAAGLVQAMQSRFEATNRLAEERARRASEKDVLLGEMNHRLKNVIARILSVARMSARHATDVDSFMVALTGRLQALAVAQDSLTETRGREGNLDRLVRAEVEQIQDGESLQIEVGGTPVMLDDSQSQAIGLVVHELMTNSAKYGALARDGGIRITWQTDTDATGNRQVILTWEETGISLDADLQREGFGTRLARTMMEGQLRGGFSRTAKNGTLTVRLNFPYREPDDT
ncbi:CHASE domain-containing protein [Maricaulis sp. CAU 1757]